MWLFLISRILIRIKMKCNFFKNIVVIYWIIAVCVSRAGNFMQRERANDVIMRRRDIAMKSKFQHSARLTLKR